MGAKGAVTCSWLAHQAVGSDTLLDCESGVVILLGSQTLGFPKQSCCNPIAFLPSAGAQQQSHTTGNNSGAGPTQEPWAEAGQRDRKSCKTNGLDHARTKHIPQAAPLQATRRREELRPFWEPRPRARAVTCCNTCLGALQFLASLSFQAPPLSPCPDAVAHSRSRFWYVCSSCSLPQSWRLWEHLELLVPLQQMVCLIAHSGQTLGFLAHTPLTAPHLAPLWQVCYLGQTQAKYSLPV